MKAEIEDNCLFLTPISSTEEYAFDAWSKTQGINMCTNEITTKNIWCYAYKRKRITLFKRIWFKIQLFFCK